MKIPNSPGFLSCIAGLLPAVLVLAGAAGPARAEPADTSNLQTLMQRNNCIACHQIDKRKYGPNFVEIAARYAGDEKATAALAAKIKSGGTGVWGLDIMPPQPQMSDEHARTMAELILALPH